MAESPLYDPSDQYDERNNFLFFLLGVLSLSRSLSTQLSPRDHAPSSSEREQSQSSTGTDDLRELLI